MEPSILGVVDHAHAAAAQLLDDAVVRDDLVDHERVQNSGCNINPSLPFSAALSAPNGSARVSTSSGGNLPRLPDGQVRDGGPIFADRLSSGAAATASWRGGSARRARLTRAAKIPYIPDFLPRHPDQSAR